MEVLHAFAEPFVAPDGRAFAVRALADEANGRWHGWLGFVPLAGGPVLVTRRETTQASRDDLVYWVGGLSPVYLEGAFGRASPIVTDAAADDDERAVDGDAERA